ncbi:PliI family lysozyme inhibitor of I-type lysozyme [Spirosoma panaciterrae]|uniref:PliI family lysozyme inhibitor of I-type lysozyme n=1 Tax=Spirosoma panaciterrae TaxID=496058 RepID=UPI00036C71C7|nr:PliI family lysozyme inhibitor of I-type lysozyme [Spirosoma panaciterrae]
MGIQVGCLFLGLLGLLQLGQGRLQQVATKLYSTDGATCTGNPLIVAPQYSKQLRFNIYTFSVTASDTGRVRQATIKAYRGELLLTNFQVRVDGAVVGAEVADLDGNRFPELYLYSTSYGSGSFGRVYAWQFLPERKADITIPNWQLTAAAGYMGHDSLWVEQSILCRKYPVYQDGDANAEPSGGYRMMRYQLQPSGLNYALIAE